MAVSVEAGCEDYTARAQSGQSCTSHDKQSILRGTPDSSLSQWTNSVRHTVKSTSLLSPSQLQNDQQDCDPCSDFPQPGAAGIFQSNLSELVSSVWTTRWSQLLPAEQSETHPFWLIFVVPVGSDNNADDSHYHQADCVYSYNFISSNQSQDRRKNRMKKILINPISKLWLNL